MVAAMSVPVVSQPMTLLQEDVQLDVGEAVQKVLQSLYVETSHEEVGVPGGGLLGLLGAIKPGMC